MFRKKTLVVLSLLVLTSGCFSTRNWTKKDFADHARTRPGAGKYELKFFGHEVNLKMGICCFKYLDSQYNLDVLPVRQIKKYMEKKYGVQINISQFESLRRAGKFKTRYSLNKGKDMINYNKNYISVDGISLYGTIFTYGSWAYLNWSEYKEKISLMSIKKKLEKGTHDQMQIFITTNLFGCTARVFLRIREGKPDSDGYYKLASVAEEKISLPFTARGCNLEDMKKSVRNMHTQLK